MAANTAPIFVLNPKINWGTISAANTAKDGTGTVVTVFTAGANGAKVDRMRIRGLGTNIATVLRIFINNGSDPTVAANNILVHEINVAATTLSETLALTNLEAYLDYALPAGYKLNITLGTAIAAGLAVSVHGGDY